MKLISMTAFVLEQNEILKVYKNHNKAPLFKKCVQYAQLLKQPLTLGMFVPCDDDDDIVLEEPLHIELYEGSTYDLDCKIYKEAQSKVIFKDFIYDNNFCLLGNDCAISIIKNTFRIANTYEDRLPSQEIKVYTIEDLIPYNLDLAVSF